MCASDVQAVSTAEQSSSGAAMKVKADRAQVSSAEKSLASADASLATARASAALYGQSSTFTKLPSVGQILTRGQSLYQIGGQPVVLLYGSVLPTRAFIAGMSAGSDVGELNANLDALGYGQGLTGDTFSAATAAAIRAFQSARGLTVTGELLLGSVVFEPGAGARDERDADGRRDRDAGTGARNQLDRSPGQARARRSPAGECQEGRSGHDHPARQPDHAGTNHLCLERRDIVAGKAGEEEGAPTIEVDATPTDPAATGRLDEAPVNVSITTESVENALVVPVDALLALAGGGYAVEIAEGRVHHLTAVTLGLFDDADGLVQVSGRGLSAGQRVVVPAT